MIIRKSAITIIGLTTCFSQFSAKTAIAAPWNTDKICPHSIIVSEARSAGYRIDKKEYGLVGASHWNETNINYAIISLFGTNTLSFIDTFSCQSAKYKMDPITTVFQSKMIEWHIIASNSNRKLIFWDLPSWNPRKYSSREYTEKFALPLYNGIILIINTKLRANNAAFYKEIYDCIHELIPDDHDRIMKTHIPVYIVRTEIEDELIQRLDQKVLEHKCYDNRENIWLQWLLPQSILSHSVFMKCLNEIMDEIKNEISRVLDGVCYDNIWRIRDEIEQHLFVVSTDWENRMITTELNGISNGYNGLLRRMKLNDTCDVFDRLLYGHCVGIYVSQLYSKYVLRKWETKNYIFSSIVMGITIVSVFVSGTMLYYNICRSTSVYGEP